MKKQMKLRNIILLITILITTSILLLFGYVSNRQFKSLLTERMVDDYQETVNTMQKNVETLINYAQDFTKYMSLNDEVLNAIIEYENMTEENKIRDYMGLKEKWDELSNELIYSAIMMTPWQASRRISRKTSSRRRWAEPSGMDGPAHSQTVPLIRKEAGLWVRCREISQRYSGEKNRGSCGICERIQLC